MTTAEHTETKHNLDDRITKADAFEVFRLNFNSIKVMVYSDFMVYGPFHAKFSDSTIKTASYIIQKFNLPLVAKINTIVVRSTLVIEGI